MRYFKSDKMTKKAKIDLPFTVSRFFVFVLRSAGRSLLYILDVVGSSLVNKVVKPV